MLNQKQRQTREQSKLKHEYKSDLETNTRFPPIQRDNLSNART